MSSTTTPLPAETGVVELTTDSVGRLVTADGFAYYLTECCGGSATGSFAGDVPVVACRACYTAIDDRLGDAWLVSDTEAWAAWARRERLDLLTSARILAIVGATA